MTNSYCGPTNSVGRVQRAFAPCGDSKENIDIENLIYLIERHHPQPPSLESPPDNETENQKTARQKTTENRKTREQKRTTVELSDGKIITNSACIRSFRGNIYFRLLPKPDFEMSSKRTIRKKPTIFRKQGPKLRLQIEEATSDNDTRTRDSKPSLKPLEFNHDHTRNPPQAQVT